MTTRKFGNFGERQVPRPQPRTYRGKTIHRTHIFLQFWPLTNTEGIYRIGGILFGGTDALCDSVSRQKSGNTTAPASLARQPLSRATGKRRPLHSDQRLPRDTVLSCERLFVAHEQPRRQPDAKSELAALHPGTECERTRSFFPQSPASGRYS